MDLFSQLINVLTALSGLAYICSLFLSFIPQQTVLCLCSFFCFFGIISRLQTQQDLDAEKSKRVFFIIFTLLSLFPLFFPSGGGLFRIILAVTIWAIMLFRLLEVSFLVIGAHCLVKAILWGDLFLLLVLFVVGLLNLGKITPFLFMVFVLWQILTSLLRFFTGRNLTFSYLVEFILILLIGKERYNAIYDRADQLFYGDLMAAEDNGEEEQENIVEEVEAGQEEVDEEEKEASEVDEEDSFEDIAEADDLEDADDDESLEDAEIGEATKEANKQEEDNAPSKPQVKWEKDHWVLVYPKDKTS